MLAERAGPIRMRAGDQVLTLSSTPAFVHQQFGIVGDVHDLDHSLDTRAERIERLEEAVAEHEAERRLAGDASEVVDASEEARTEEAEATRSEDEADASV
jgi:hypothetical protein